MDDDFWQYGNLLNPPFFSPLVKEQRRLRPQLTPLLVGRRAPCRQVFEAPLGKQTFFGYLQDN